MQINDFERPHIPALERPQLWFGLVAWAERPESFDPSIDSSRILARAADTLERELHRGSSVRVDSVRLVAEDRIEILAGQGGEFAGSVLSVRIEEPQTTALFLRFSYELRGANVPTDAAEQCALRQAYYFADIETVRQIRLVAPLVL